MPSGENTVKLNFHEGLRRHNLYPHFQIMDFSISNGNLRCKFCLECSMVGAMTILAYVNSVSPSCVYFITLHRLHKQTRAESEHINQNQNQRVRQEDGTLDDLCFHKKSTGKITLSSFAKHQKHWIPYLHTVLVLVLVVMLGLCTCLLVQSM